VAAKDQMKQHRVHESLEKKKQGNLANTIRMKHTRAEESSEKMKQENLSDKLQKEHSKAQETSKSADHTTKTKSKLKIMEESIKTVKQKVLKAFQRTQEENDGLRHKADVCIICDCFIIGNDSIRYLRGKVIKKHLHRIDVASYQEYYKTVLKN
jgi:hypothetical protein